LLCELFVCLETPFFYEKSLKKKDIRNANAYMIIFYSEIYTLRKKDVICRICFRKTLL